MISDLEDSTYNNRFRVSFWNRESIVIRAFISKK
ncbi:Uncharacterised protein [Kurthia zopfii]|uniref:Uncharacterized protein n=1 Tax=Kurthia zopfii TaxID=1650 RepID=A0A8B4Q9N5_9BACL|nr:hypothetical protein DFR61_12742 [Kurthia zopfii]STX09439.1 Uncharacterised protein [Kurthia zopfii]